MSATDGVALERALPVDVGELLTLMPGAPGATSAAALDRERAAGRLWVLRGPAGLVAWCSVRWVADELQIEDLGVAPGQRRRGWGRRLLRLLLELARQRGVAAAHLEVRRGNTAARSLYSSAGFEAVGQRRGYYREPQDDAILMRRLCSGVPAVEIGRGRC